MAEYELLSEQLRGFAESEPHFLPLLSNAAALLWQGMEEINWAGFYLKREGELVLGPFQGKPACIKIPFGKGVCGAAVTKDEVVLVPDVHLFPGHIACDSASESEIVLPLHFEGKIIGVLDIDSPKKGRFTEEDKAGLEAFRAVLEELCDFSCVKF